MRKFSGLVAIAIPLLSLSACAMSLRDGASGLATQPDEWPPIGIHRLELLHQLGPGEPSYATTDGVWREQMTWKYEEVYVPPLGAVAGAGMVMNARGRGMTGIQNILVVEFDKGGLLVSRTWHRSVLVIENPYTGQFSWQPVR